MTPFIPLFAEPFLTESEVENYSPQVERLIAQLEEDQQQAAELERANLPSH